MMLAVVALSLIVLGAGVQSLPASPKLLGRLMALETQIAAKEVRIKQLEAIRRVSSRQTGDGPIAFTAYLEVDLDNLTPKQTIVFNAVLHNSGNGYDNTTGVFTAPVSGVYYFTFFVGQIDTNQVNIMMTVNDVNYVDALAEGIATLHNDQGGNAAVVKLNAGDRVQVIHRKVGSHIEGSTFLRLSTFSGFLIYHTNTSSTGGTSIIG